MRIQKRTFRQPRKDRPADAEAVGLQLRRNSACYFSEFVDDDVRVELTWSNRRRMSAVFEFDLMGRQSRRSVIVKLNRVRGTDGGQVVRPDQQTLDRPRLAPWIPRDERVRLEHHALRVIENHFGQLGDERFCVVRPLDLLPEGPALVMEKLPFNNLRDMFVRQHRGGKSSGEAMLLRASRNAGSWLREFHRIPPLSHATTRHARRSDFVRLMHEFADFLGETLSRKRYFRSVAELVAEQAARVLPDSLPLRLLHGDYGARNLLVDNRGAVAGLDTPARCRGPLYEDLAYFRVMLRTNSPQFFGARICYPSHWTECLGDEFLRGYFAGLPIPREAIRLFEIGAEFEKWAFFAFGYRKAKGWRRAAKRCQLEMYSHFFFRDLRQLVEEIRASASTPCTLGANDVAATNTG